MLLISVLIACVFGWENQETKSRERSILFDCIFLPIIPLLLSYILSIW